MSLTIDVLELKAGDTLLVGVDKGTHYESMLRIGQQLRDLIPREVRMVVCESLDLVVIPGPAASADASGDQTIDR